MVRNGVEGEDERCGACKWKPLTKNKTYFSGFGFERKTNFK